MLHSATSGRNRALHSLPPPSEPKFHPNTELISEHVYTHLLSYSLSLFTAGEIRHFTEQQFASCNKAEKKQQHGIKKKKKKNCKEINATGLIFKYNGRVF